VPALLAMAASLCAQDLLLARIKNRMADNLRRQPNYTCLETIERTRRPHGAKAQIADTLRMEVALVEGKELFAWPGSKKFEDTDLRDMISTGTFGSGNYALHARTVFLSSAPTFEARGETTLRGRTLIRYDFRVARLVSGYHMTVGTKEAIVGYRGSFYTDPETLDVQRLEVVVEEIPPELGVTAASDSVTYGWLDIGGRPFLLPLESELAMVLGGQENRNYTRFTGCREYSGESVLRFDDPLPDQAAGPVVEEVEIPAGLSVTLALSTALDLSHAAVGDPVEAELRGDLKHRKQVLAPKGARVAGRITRLERHDDHIVFGVSFQEMEWPGWRARVKLELDRMLGVDAAVFGRTRPIYDSRPGEGIVLLRPGRARLSRGILMLWRT